MTYRLIHGDCLASLRTMEPESVDCCVTSPPYWGLRDYGTGHWRGGREDCDHKRPPMGGPPESSTLVGTHHRAGFSPDGQYRLVCEKCEAVRVDEQKGLESTPAGYVAGMVEVFREVRRVLKDDGTLWLNLGDSYAGGGSGGYSDKSTLEGFSRPDTKGRTLNDGAVTRKPSEGLKPKDLVGIPWRVAFALQADGWYLRSDIIWAKPNPMPESVTDRPTKAHEYLFLLSKSERYFYDAGAIAETSLNAGAVVKTNGSDGYEADGMDLRTRDGFKRGVTVKDTRNKRTVWTISSEPYAGAHFAVMPTALVKPCVLAGCRPGGTVLDPFTGSGTVGVVAIENGCDFVGCELNPAYIEIIKKRLDAVHPALDFTAAETKAISAQLAFDLGSTTQDAESVVRARLARGEKSIDL